MDGFNLILSAVCLNQSCSISQPDDDAVNFNLIFGDEANMEEQINSVKKSLNGTHLKIATLNDPPLSYVEEINGTLVGGGVAFRLVEFIAEKLNFTYEIIVPHNNIIGSKNDLNGSLLQIMRDKTADIGAAFVPILNIQKTLMDYSSVTLDEGEWIIVMRRPEESATGSGLLAPFEFWVWVLILVSLLAVGPIIYVLIIIRNKLTGDKQQKPYSLGHCAWFVYGALMKQGSTLSPIADSTRLLFATWWIFITILTSFYTANLTAFLTLSKFTLPYNSMEDILRKQTSFITLRGRGIEYAITNEGEPLDGLNKMVTNGLAHFMTSVNDSNVLTEYVEKKNFVFIRDRPAISLTLYHDYQYRRSINMKNEKVHCPFAVSKTPILKMNRAFVYPKNSKLKYTFDHELLNLVEAGISKHLLEERLPNAEICPPDLGGTERQLRNTDFLMTYFIMLAGFVTATVVFVSELVFRWLNEKSQISRSESFTTRKVPKRPFVHTMTPPPPYASIFQASRNIALNMNRFNAKKEVNGVRKYINGRDYIVAKGPKGEHTLIPVRAPSATLFQFTYTE